MTLISLCHYQPQRGEERGSRPYSEGTGTRRFGFEIVGTLPGAFRHPTQGLVDAFVMYRRL